MRRTLLTCITLLLVSISSAEANPFLRQSQADADGKLGAFGQNNTGDCFFLASLLAIAQDSDGQALIESSLQRHSDNEGWRIIFPNLSSPTIDITSSEQQRYRLMSANGAGVSPPAWGDADVGLLEIAADKVWKNAVKAQGLWDDVPMNALFMFSGSPQLLLWNRDKATAAHSADIDKYRRLPPAIVTELAVNSTMEAEQRLKKLLNDDHDGVTLVLIDYLDYHADAVVDIDFDRRSYRYINPHQSTRLEGDLDALLEGLAGGYYALNYIEIAAPRLRLE